MLDNVTVIDSDAIRSAKFRSLVHNIPQPGDILTTEDGEPVELIVDTNGAGKDVMYCYAHVAQDATGWYLNPGNMGLKVMIAPRSQEVLANLRLESVDKVIQVNALRVVRQSENRKSVVGELFYGA